MANKNEVIAQQLREWLLIHQPFPDGAADIAEALGVTTPQLKKAITWLRKPEVVSVTGWTIPYQKGGPALHNYRILDKTEATADDIDAGFDSNDLRRGQHVKRYHRELAQIDLEVAATPGRSPQGRKARKERRIFDGALALIEP